MSIWTVRGSVAAALAIARRKEWSHCALSKALQQLRESEHSQRILEFAP
jgi:hypothetical protein